MTLTFESTHEYVFDKPSMFYCKDHNMLRVVDNYSDSVMISGVTQETIEEFISGYNKYVLEKTLDKEVVNAED